MTAAEIMIIRDYLTRKRWYFATGFILHLAAMIGCWWMGVPIFLGIYGGCAILLMFELQRGGNATARTMLSLPMTAAQLARCWRFVGLEFPVILFLIPLLLGAGIGAALGAPHLTAEFLLIIAISQTLCLGILFFALTGLPGLPRPGATLWQRLIDIIHGMLWGGSMLSILFFSMATPRRFADLDRGGMIAGILLAVATLAGWFRADTLVRNRAARPGTRVRSSEKLAPTQNAREWQRVGAMTFLCLRFGSLTLTIIMFILLIQWIATGWFSSGSKHQMNLVKSQIGMMTVITVFIMLCNLLGQLRVLRTLPIRTSVLTHWLVFWPLGLASMVWLLAQTVFSLLYGAPVEWHLFGQSLVGAAFMVILLPLTLRFGLKVWTILPVMMFAAFVSSAGRFVFGGLSEIHGAWWAAASVIFLLAVWWISYRLLGTPHPWRANAMKGLMAARRM